MNFKESIKFQEKMWLSILFICVLMKKVR